MREKMCAPKCTKERERGRDSGDAHRDTLFLAPLGDRCLELGEALLSDVFLEKVGAFDLGCVVREDRTINEAEREMLQLEAEWEV